MMLLLFALIAVLVIGGAVALHRSIRLKGQFQPYLHTFETASVGMSHLDLDGRWIRMNQKMAEITGYPIDELMQMSFDKISLAEDIPKNTEMNANLVAGEIDSYSLEKRYQRKDGRVIWVK